MKGQIVCRMTALDRSERTGMRFFDCPISPVADTRRSRVLHTLITVLLSLCVLANMAMIFRMSAEDRSESGDRSGEIADAVVDVVYPDFEQRPVAEQESIFQKVHKFIRKLAHFSEFALLGFLTAILVTHLAARYSRLTPVLQWMMPAAFCLLYAASDEIHQIFTERGPSVTDVLLDFTGAICGILVARIIIWIACTVIAKAHAQREKGVISA